MPSSSSAERTAKKQKRCSLNEDEVGGSAVLGPANTGPPLHTGPCLLHLLQPIRHCLHTFLSAKDAFCLMRAGRSTTAALLAGYDIFDIEHASAYGRRTVADTKRSIALFARYDMRILAMRLPKEWDEPLLDVASGVSVLPASLIALVLGSGSYLKWPNSSSALTALFSGSSAFERSKHECSSRTQPRDVDEQRDGSERLTREVDGDMHNVVEWSVLLYMRALAPFNQPITPGALPPHLRILQLNEYFNQPLQRGSIPDTVELLQFGKRFNQPLDVGHLPSSLVQLNLGDFFNRPLLPGVLPAGLKRLHFGDIYSLPLEAGVLPAHLEELCFSFSHNQILPPGVIPPSVRYLSLGGCFNQPLQPGSIPEGVYHLDLGGCDFNQPLLPGVLPSSLRQLRISERFNHPLQPGSLPDGLELLSFGALSFFAQPLLPGVIPESVTAIDMGMYYGQDLLPGSIPASVQWLRLPDSWRSRDLTSVLPPSTRVLCYV